MYFPERVGAEALQRVESRRESALGSSETLIFRSFIRYLGIDFTCKGLILSQYISSQSSSPLSRLRSSPHLTHHGTPTARLLHPPTHLPPTTHTFTTTPIRPITLHLVNLLQHHDLSLECSLLTQREQNLCLAKGWLLSSRRAKSKSALARSLGPSSFLHNGNQREERYLEDTSRFKDLYCSMAVD